jgi:RHS repeat-associated protein
MLPTSQKQAQGDAANQQEKNFMVSPPTINLPKGGGAIRGIGEKFAANPVTGTGSMTVPIATSPGRSGFGPQLNLSYDSGSGNGPFGFGWSLSLPSITRKTDKGLPRYLDDIDSDVFILSGAEDLVPMFRKNAQGAWVLGGNGHHVIYEEERLVGETKYRVRRYRPRVEGLFARIERWTDLQSREIHWRSITRDNITTLYGKDNNSRIFEPENPTHIFSWLIYGSFDDKGNAISYEYAEENSAGVGLGQISEANRTDRTRSANRYLKRIYYGNTESLLSSGQSISPLGPDFSQLTWLFEVIFDYGEGHYNELPLDLDKRQFVLMERQAPVNQWPARQDPVSSYRSGFEVRTYRLCRRVLMLHHFQQELGIKDYLVKSTEFDYLEGPVASFIRSIKQAGFVHKPDSTNRNRFLRKTLPPLEFEYSCVPSADELARQRISSIEASSLENLPYGLDGSNYQWVDLDGEGTSGILTEQGGTWYYKRNLSANNFPPEGDGTHPVPDFGSMEVVSTQPNAVLGRGASQFLDLAGDGQLDVVQMDGPARGFYERTLDGQWLSFQPFRDWPDISPRDPNLKLIDLTGDGHTDILITEDNVFTWHPSLAEQGYGPAQRTFQAHDEDQGPRLVFSDAEGCFYLADLSGDGLTDLVRIRNGEVCYWPNLGYGCFGAKVTMDHSPWFDRAEQFDQRRIRLADTDGSGTTDILYLHGEDVRIYFNQSGNGWSEAAELPQFPPVENISSVQALDLLCNGTACLVWSSPLPGSMRQSMRYIDLMGTKPHLLIGVKNNLGAETLIRYAPSTKFYLDDKKAGKPWITKLPFLVHVVERVDTYDYISRNRFVTRYAYHHGYYDGVEREFRGFGMVEQYDTEEFAGLSESDEFPAADNIEAASHVPPVLTKTWFHTGVYLGGDRISNFFAGLLDGNDAGEYYREPGLSDAEARLLLLEDTALPANLSAEEEREACRALKGAMLRQEVYAVDQTEKESHPYLVTEQNFTIEWLQPQADNQHAVFFTHPREAISYHYERNAADPRITHNITLQVDDFGNVLKSVAVGYGRRKSDLPEVRDQKKQTTALLTYTESDVTNKIDATNGTRQPDAYRTPVVWQTRTYELTGYTFPSNAIRFSFGDLVELKEDGLALRFDEEIPYEAQATLGRQRRLIEHVRTLFRADDLTRLLAGGKIEPLGLTGESYKLAFTPGLLVQVYQRGGKNLLPALTNLLGGTGPDQGGYRQLDGNGHWWIPSGRLFYSANADAANPAGSAPQELAEARSHFFTQSKIVDPFGNSATVEYDPYDLLIASTKDALENEISAASDYRLLQPVLITDPNRNRAQVAFDALGMVAGTAVMGKEFEPDGQPKGDSLDGFEPDLTQAQLDAFMNKPREAGASSEESAATQIVHDLLGSASTRIVYDLDRYKLLNEPPFAATIARETHIRDLPLNTKSKLQVSFSYSDGFGREIQKKIQAEPGPIVEGGATLSPRWVGSGWTIFNNKGKPVRQYEPFFDDTHMFKFGKKVGVSPILFYDPVERVVATSHPNNTYEKVLFDAWEQITYDVNDTVNLNPNMDPDVQRFFEKLPEADYLPTWYEQRTGGGKGPVEKTAADKASMHAGTPTTTCFDTLGRIFLTIAHNKFQRNGNDVEEKYSTRAVLDIEGNQREVIDAKGRVVMRYDYDLLGNRIHQSSMEAGERWMLNDVAGKPIRSWDSRGHDFRTEYDVLRRPVAQFVIGTDNSYSDPRTLGQEILFGKAEYGEGQPNDRALNLRTRLFNQYDSAGIVTNEGYDFKGNSLQSRREVAQAYKDIPDWSGAVQTDGSFTSYTTYDALNRPVTLISPDGSITRPTFNEANLLEHLEANLRGAATRTTFIDDIDYNAKGQRILIQYHLTGTNQYAETKYTYDPETFRLMRLLTTRPSAPKTVQDLNYTYDPVGNITHIQDDAQDTIFFRNQRVEPSNTYTYDAVNRLIEAEGREHLGQNGNSILPPSPTSYNDASHVGRPHPNNREAMGTYQEFYAYDEVGNFINLIHHGKDPANTGWTRTYAYNEDSQLERGRKSNRLTRAAVGSLTELYSASGDGYDPHGNMLHMPQLQVMGWDYRDQLCVSQRQKVDDQDEDGIEKHGERTYYVYDAAGQRVRKITERQNVTRKEERIYLGGFELYRKYGNDGTALSLEWETLHIMDDKQPIALVETKSYPKPILSLRPEQLTRYQFSNHLGSAMLELDDDGIDISYEEYHPYGSSAYQGIRDRIKVPKRYRYTGKERDEESGFYYHGARYYACWLARWMNTDPGGLIDGPNLYQYVNDNPIIMTDPNGKAGNSTAPVLDPETVIVVRTALQAAALAWGGRAGVIRGGAGLAMLPRAAVLGSVDAAFAAAYAAAIIALLVISTERYMRRSASIVRYGNPLGMPKEDLFFPLLQEVRAQQENSWKLRQIQNPFPVPVPVPARKSDKEERPPLRGRIYVTYTKFNVKTGLFYSGRTSAVIDLNKDLDAQAEAAVKSRDANHHIDENDEPQDPSFLPAVLDVYTIGFAVNYKDRYRDPGYWAIRGREQQLIDHLGAKQATILGVKDFHGGAQSDTDPGPRLTENPFRAVSKDNPLGEFFHGAANVTFGTNEPYTGYKIGDLIQQ